MGRLRNRLTSSRVSITVYLREGGSGNFGRRVTKDSPEAFSACKQQASEVNLHELLPHHERASAQSASKIRRAALGGGCRAAVPGPLRVGYASALEGYGLSSQMSSLRYLVVIK
ncbi:hypothetical protein EVAR_28944_1 [Eumeta japonica]|uniref:Uncharacterized protein n=1 Tax=Eumeta variegata TaxID=151549 RepID=A0A4C1VZU0_EUMVA|nr:hypothetical protein EVAR_28944_1 [Eumeta japonica]